MPTRIARQALALVTMILVGYLLSACGSEGEAENEQEKLEREFQESMTGVVLEGHFTLDGKEGLSPERYEIEKVSKMPGGFWVFHARIQYGGTDVTVPVPVKIVWAGDTPVVSLTDATIPGVGTFTARVLFYRGQYVGTWSSGTHGGQQFGRIVREEAEASVGS